MKKILFISHEASRTGAPFVLYYFMRWMKKNHPEVSSECLILRDGEIAYKFEEVSNKTYNLSQLFENFRSSIFYFKDKILSLVNKKNVLEEFNDSVFNKIASSNADVIYANTVLSLPEAVKLKSMMASKPKLMLHVHELNAMIDMALPGFDSYVNEVDYFISGSEMVRNNLIVKRNINPEITKVVYEFTEVDEIVASEKVKRDFFLVGAIGTVEYRKGFDLLIQSALFIKTNYPELKIKFVWVGSVPANSKSLILSDLEKAGLADMFDFPGTSATLSDYYTQFDVFVLPSREDPFPLVCIEASMMAIPIICFENATGISEILKNGGGYCVPYLNTTKMAEQIIYYYKNPQEVIKDGLAGMKLFSEFTPEKGCPQIYNVLTELVKT